MYYLWVAFRNRGKGFYLPKVENWSGRIYLSPRDTGLSDGCHIPVLANDGVWTIQPPDTFDWKDAGDEKRILEENKAYTLTNRVFEIVVRAALYSRESVRFIKYTWPQNGTITIGRDSDCTIVYPNPLVSGHHLTLRRQNERSCMLQETSSNGTYINRMLVRHNENLTLSVGDRITVLPGLHLYFLGDVIALSHPEDKSFTAALPLFAGKEGGIRGQDVSIFREYHRAPRQVQQANEEEIEIQAPLSKEKKQEVPTILAIGPSMTMVMPMLVSALAMGRGNVGASLAMVGTSAAMAVMWGLLNRRHQKKESILAEENRQAICRQYYAEMEEKLASEVNREQSRLMHNYLSVGECVQLPQSNDHRLWERLPAHRDFLSIRLGLGERPLPGKLTVPKVQISLVDDPLRDEPQRLYEKYSVIRQVPIVLEMGRQRIVGVLGSQDAPWLLESMIVQTAANHSYHDVKIAIIYDPDSEEKWKWAKWLPHVYADDSQTMRMVVSHPEAVREVLSHIYDELCIRKDRLHEQAGDRKDDEEEEPDYTQNLPYYLIFCTDTKLIEEHPIMRLVNGGEQLGYTLVLQTTSMELLPKECGLIIDSKNSLGAVYASNGQMTGVQFEATDSTRLHAFSQAISAVRVKDSMEDSAIPTLVTFLEVYHARRVEDLDVWRFWNENHAYQGIRSYIGMKAGSVPFVLDISDKNHGPHGLIAGTTGAGKSVLLQSYILSLAINYSPTEVQFILIDYKGGGTSEDFRNLPHVAGVIDSLQGERAIFRALASIKGEILRREEIFKQRGVNSIDDYMRLFNPDPEADSLGHLIIIVDEFAELKKEQPDFMHELVSAARVGRSLGMHLILATQKPSNSVSDEIAANTRFRVCLRVASKSDSNEMLHRPEAAYLKGMGRCYVQVGNDEIFEEIQTSWSGADYQPDALRTDEEPRLLDEAGRPLKFKKKKKQDGAPKREINELKAVLAYLSKTLEDHRAKPAKKLWLEELAHVLMLTELPAFKEACYRDGQWPNVSSESLQAFYAMADDVDTQQYLPVCMDFTEDKNQMIIGLSGMGKTTAIQTIAVSLALRYTPEQVIMYFFSLTSKSLSSLSALPHVGDIVYEESVDEQVRLLELIYNESERRRKLFAQMTTDNYIQYNRAAANSNGEFETVPAIVVFIDRMQQMRALEEQGKEDALQLFYNLLRSGASQGIYFVMTAFARNELPGKYHPFINSVALNLNDRSDYIDALNTRIPITWGGISSCQGRGVVAIEDKNKTEDKVLEIQVALYGTNSSDTDRSRMISALGEQMTEAWHGRLPEQISRIPEKPVLDDLLALPQVSSHVDDPRYLPFAYSKMQGTPVFLDLEESFSMLICGPRQSGKTTAMKNLAVLFSMRGAQVHITGGSAFVEWGRTQGFHTYEIPSPGQEASEWELFQRELFSVIVPERSKRKKEARSRGQDAYQECVNSFEPIVILIDDLDTCVERDSVASFFAMLRYCCAQNVSQTGIYFYASLSHAAYGRNRSAQVVSALAQYRHGLLLGGRLNECDPFDTAIAYSQKNKAFPLGEGLLVSELDTTQVVLPMTEPEEET